MAHYVILANYTTEGFETLAELDPEDYLSETRATMEAHGVTLNEAFLTMGEYDAVVVVEAPDDETLSKAQLDILESGIGTTQTLRAFDEEEARELLGAVGT